MVENKEMVSKPSQDPEDLESTNLYVGKIIGNNNRGIEYEVIEINYTNIKIRILNIEDDHLKTYLDIGKVYSAFKHQFMVLDAKMQIWEIASRHMKRSSSQFFLSWEKGIGWGWELDC